MKNQSSIGCRNTSSSFLFLYIKEYENYLLDNARNWGVQRPGDTDVEFFFTRLTFLMMAWHPTIRGIIPYVPTKKIFQHTIGHAVGRGLGRTVSHVDVHAFEHNVQFAHVLVAAALRVAFDLELVRHVFNCRETKYVGKIKEIMLDWRYDPIM